MLTPPPPPIINTHAFHTLTKLFVSHPFPNSARQTSSENQ